jgi:hypothetical protein
MFIIGTVACTACCPAHVRGLRTRTGSVAALVSQRLSTARMHRWTRPPGAQSECAPPQLAPPRPAPGPPSAGLGRRWSAPPPPPAGTARSSQPLRDPHQGFGLLVWPGDGAGHRLRLLLLPAPAGRALCPPDQGDDRPMHLTLWDYSIGLLLQTTILTPLPLVTGVPADGSCFSTRP